MDSTTKSYLTVTPSIVPLPKLTHGRKKNGMVKYKWHGQNIIVLCIFTVSFYFAVPFLFRHAFLICRATRRRAFQVCVFVFLIFAVDFIILASYKIIKTNIMFWLYSKPFLIRLKYY